MSRSQNLEILGLPPQAGPERVREARRALSLLHHPDRGGDPAVMARINRAADELLDELEAVASAIDSHGPDTSPFPRRAVVADRPSFTVDVLPVVAHEVLTLAVSNIGEIVDDEPPYLLEFSLIRERSDAERVWCRAEIVPDAGSSTISLTVEAASAEDVTRIRDILVREINELGFER